MKQLRVQFAAQDSAEVSDAQAYEGEHCGRRRRRAERVAIVLRLVVGDQVHEHPCTLHGVFDRGEFVRQRPLVSFGRHRPILTDICMSARRGMAGWSRIVLLSASVARSKTAKRMGRPVKYTAPRHAAQLRLDAALVKHLRAHALEHGETFTALVERVLREWWAGQKRRA